MANASVLIATSNKSSHINSVRVTPVTSTTLTFNFSGATGVNKTTSDRADRPSVAVRNRDTPRRNVRENRTCSELRRSRGFAREESATGHFPFGPRGSTVSGKQTGSTKTPVGGSLPLVPYSCVTPCMAALSHAPWLVKEKSGDHVVSALPPSTLSMRFHSTHAHSAAADVANIVRHRSNITRPRRSKLMASEPERVTSRRICLHQTASVCYWGRRVWVVVGPHTMSLR